MALVFPDPNTFPEFEAPNGITYRWDATDGKWVVGSFSDSDTVKCIGNSSTSETQDCIYRRKSDAAAANMVRGDEDGPGQPANFQRLTFGTSIDTSFLKVGGRFNIAKGSENNYFRATRIERETDNKTFVDVTPLDTETPDFFLEDSLKFTILDLPGVEGDCLKCDPEDDETICEAIGSIRNDIIELEEEIDAIAPSVERGKWRFTAVGTVANPGQFTMYDDDFGSGQPTGLFKSAKSIWFNEVDTDGVTHAFGDVDDGELLEIFVEGSPEYGLYEVVGQAHDETQGATSFWVIDVNFIRTLEDTTAVGPGEICRFKVFMAPTGGDASSFVLKTGDTMSGNLQMGDSSTYPDSTNTNSPKIIFEAEKSTGTAYGTELYGNYSGYLYSSRSFFSSGTIQSKSTSGFGYDGSTRMGFGTKSIDGSSSTTRFAYIGIGTGSDVRAMEWSGAKGLIWLKANNTTGSKGQVLKKDRTNNRPKWQGTVDISPSGTDRCVGEIWYNANDQVLYVRVS